MTTKKPQLLTLLVIPDSAGGEVRRLRIPRRVLKLALAAIVVMLVALLALSGHAVYLIAQLRDVPELRAENVKLRSEIEQIDQRLQGMVQVVDRVQQFDARLRRITMLNDPDRNLAIGPVGTPGAPEAQPDPIGTLAAANLKRDLLGPRGVNRAIELIGERMNALGNEAQATESSVKSLELHLEDQQALLGATPSLRPARGWQTSDFGFRTDPYTGLRQMHNGLDISADIGAKVIASGDGLVSHAGPQSAYGNAVAIDHGHGLVSFYAHLSEIGVKVGQEVRRGMTIGAVGNTGRSTGPHLHYEIRLNGVPQDPSRYILE